MRMDRGGLEQQEDKVKGNDVVRHRAVPGERVH